MTKKVLFILPDAGGDPTEAAGTYTILKAKGYDISFCTERGAIPTPDQKLMSGILQKTMGASAQIIKEYKTMTEDEKFNTPLRWSAEITDLKKFDIVVVPGGHDKPMRQLLESESLRNKLREYWSYTKRSEKGDKHVLAAICHGVLCVARVKSSKGDESSKSILYNVKTTTLPYFMEQSAYRATQLFMGDYYKTYLVSTAEEVESLVGKEGYVKGPYSPSPFFVVDEEYRYVSARFPGDVKVFAEAIIKEIEE